MSMLGRLMCRYLFWRGHSVSFIAVETGVTMVEVERLLFKE